MEEIWKDIDGYEGLYRVSSFGRVLSVKFGPKSNSVPVNPISKVMRQSRSSSGYLHVQLYKDGKSSTKLVHILVAKAFIANPENKLEVNHIDGNKGNNSVDNLEWVTRRENAIHAINTGLRSASPNEGRKGADNPVSKPVLQYGLDGSFIRKWASRTEAADSLRIKNSSVISACISGKNKTAGGYIWKNYDGEIQNHIDVFNVHRRSNRKKTSDESTHKCYMRPINQFSKNGVFIKRWNSANQIQSELSVPRNNVYRSCNGQRKTGNGFIWRYADELD